jgi:hypothetical protein
MNEMAWTKHILPLIWRCGADTVRAEFSVMGGYARSQGNFECPTCRKPFVYDLLNPESLVSGGVRVPMADLLTEEAVPPCCFLEIYTAMHPACVVTSPC